MILKKVYIQMGEGGGVKANLEEVYILDYFILASLNALSY